MAVLQIKFFPFIADTTVNNRAPPKASEPVKPQLQERQDPQEPASGDGDDSEWSTKVSRYSFDQFLD